MAVKLAYTNMCVMSTSGPSAEAAAIGSVK